MGVIVDRKVLGVLLEKPPGADFGLGDTFEEFALLLLEEADLVRLLAMVDFAGVCCFGGRCCCFPLA